MMFLKTVQKAESEGLDANESMDKFLLNILVLCFGTMQDTRTYQ